MRAALKGSRPQGHGHEQARAPAALERVFPITLGMVVQQPKGEALPGSGRAMPFTFWHHFQRSSPQPDQFVGALNPRITPQHFEVEAASVHIGKAAESLLGFVLPTCAANSRKYFACTRAGSKPLDFGTLAKILLLPR